MTRIIQRRWWAVVVGLLAVLAVVTGIIVAAGTAAAASTTTAATAHTATAAAVQPPNGTATATPTPTPTPTPPGGNGTAGGPTMASQARISPTKLTQAEYLTVTVHKPDAVFNTSGDMVLFEVSEPLTAARITQSKAEATVLEGGHVVLVEYQPDAAPPNSQSLYTLELYFRDGSTKTVRLYASETDKSVAAADLKQFEPFIETACDFAKEHGYQKCTPATLTEHLENVEDKADLVEHFFTRYATQAIALFIAAGRNPLVVIMVVGGIGYFAYRRYLKEKAILEELATRASRYEQKLERLRLDRQQAKQTADDDTLGEVPAIGTTYSKYWEAAYGVKSPYQLAHLASAGALGRREVEVDVEAGDGDGDGEGGEGGEPATATETRYVRVHDGITDIDADDLDDLSETWLEPIIRHLNSKQALTHIARAIDYLETQHKLGEHHQEARDHLAYLLSELDRRSGSPNRATVRGEPTAGRAGGDD